MGEVTPAPYRSRRTVPPLSRAAARPGPGGRRVPQPTGAGPGHPGRAADPPLRRHGAAVRRSRRIAPRAAPVTRTRRPGGHGRGAAGHGHGPQPVPAARRLRTGGRELADAEALFAPEGWVDEPATYHRTPPRLDDGDLTTAADGPSARPTNGCRGTAGSPPTGASRARSGGRDSAPTPRRPPPCSATPTRPDRGSIAVHGFCMGFPFMDFPGLHAPRLHHELGVNVALPGAAAARPPPGHPGERRAVPLLRAHERRPRADPGRVGRPAAHQLDPVPGRAPRSACSACPWGLHGSAAGRSRTRARRCGGRHPGRRLPRVVPPRTAPVTSGSGRSSTASWAERPRTSTGWCRHCASTRSWRPTGATSSPATATGWPRPTRPAGWRSTGRPGGVVVLGQPRRLPVVPPGHRVRRGVAGRGRWGRPSQDGGRLTVGAR